MQALVTNIWYTMLDRPGKQWKLASCRGMLTDQGSHPFQVLSMSDRFQHGWFEFPLRQPSAMLRPEFASTLFGKQAVRNLETAMLYSRVTAGSKLATLQGESSGAGSTQAGEPVEVIPAGLRSRSWRACRLLSPSILHACLIEAALQAAGAQRYCDADCELRSKVPGSGRDCSSRQQPG